MHHYWLAANIKEKEQISKNLLLNLTLDGNEVASSCWLEPFAHMPNSGLKSYGGPQGQDLEPKEDKYLAHLEWAWDWFVLRDNKTIVLNFSALYETLKSVLEPRF